MRRTSRFASPTHIGWVRGPRLLTAARLHADCHSPHGHRPTPFSAWHNWRVLLTDVLAMLRRQWIATLVVLATAAGVGLTGD